MEPEVLAQHQVEEFKRLRERYYRWRITSIEAQQKLVSSTDKNADGAFICVAQTVAMLELVISNLDHILEQK